MKIIAIKGRGGVQRLRANAILYFHVYFPLMHPKGNNNNPPSSLYRLVAPQVL